MMAAAQNFVRSVFCNVGLPYVLVSDSGTRFTSAFWTSLHTVLGSTLTFGSLNNHHNTTIKVELVTSAASQLRNLQLAALRCQRTSLSNATTGWSSSRRGWSNFAINDLASPATRPSTAESTTPTTASTFAAL